MQGLGRQIREIEDEITQLQQEISQGGQKKDEIASLREDLSFKKDDLKHLWIDRVTAWQDCSRSEIQGNYSLPEAIYIGFGEYYKVANKTQVRQILEVLDHDHLGWDDERPKPNADKWVETYFATLETNFPELVKATKGPTRKSGKRPTRGGCLSVVVIAFLTAFALFLIVVANSKPS